MNISCVIVNYNNASYLERAVMSVLGQTLPPGEIIIADDASTDGSVDIINRLADANKCIRPIFRENNIGVAANRDLAIKASRGQFFTTLDSDDWFYPEKVEKEYLALEGSLSAIACSDVDLVQHEAVFDTINMLSFCALSEPSERLLFLVSRKKGMPRDMMMAKSLYLDTGGMRHALKRYEDWDLKIRLAEKEVIWVHSGIVGMAYLREGTGLSSVNQFRHTLDKIRVLFPGLVHSDYRATFSQGMFDLFFKKGARKVFKRKGMGNEII